MPNFIAKTNSNLIPCEGPRAIRVVFNFEMSGELECDFTPDVTRGVISELQSAYVDNLDGSDVLIVCNLTQQRVKIPAGYQGYIQLLVSTDARIYVRMNDPGVFTMHMLNTPVVHSLVASNTIGAPPLTPDSTGRPGQFAVDLDYFYWCFAPDSWARIAADPTWV